MPLVTEAAVDTVAVCVRGELLPVHVGQVEVVVDAPDLPGDTAERRAVFGTQIYYEDGEVPLRRGPINDEEDRSMLACQCGGADVIRQGLDAGIVDELHIIVAPVILGGGKHLFQDFTKSLDLENRRVRQSRWATFIEFGVRR